MIRSFAASVTLIGALVCQFWWPVCIAAPVHNGRSGKPVKTYSPVSLQPGSNPGKDSITRVLFLGNSITWAGIYVNDIDAYLTATFPSKKFYLINAGLPSETVSGLSEEGHANGNFPRPDLHERLARVLEATKPDLVFACYGMNDGIYLPFDSGRFQAFKEGINWLHDAVKKAGARLIHVTPPIYDERRGKSEGYGHVLDEYSNWLLTNRSLGWEVADVHFPMQKFQQQQLKKDTAFFLAEDGVHPGETGHWLMAKQLLIYLGCKHLRNKKTIEAALKQVAGKGQYLKLITACNNMLRDAWLTKTKHLRPGLPIGLPMDEAMEKYSVLRAEILALANPSNTYPAP